MISVYGIAARFRIFIRCDSCLSDSHVLLDVPAVEDAPDDVSALLESAFLERQQFQCVKCQSPIAHIVGVRQFRRKDAA